MIKNIFNWVGGGFFRTIGRFVAFVVLGYIAFLLLGKSNTSLGQLLGFEYVKADSWKSGTVTWTDGSGNVLPQYYGQYKEFDYGTSYVNNMYKMVGATNVPTGTKGVLFSVVFRQFDNPNQFVCTDYINTGGTGTSATCVRWTNYQVQNMSFNMMYNSESQVFNCYWYDNTFTTYMDNVTYIRGLLYCPVTATSNLNRLEYNGQVGTTGQTGKYSIGFERTIFYDVSSDSAISGAINNQTNQTISAITETNLTETNSTASSFFDNFSDVDHGGLSSIITAPLTTIQSMLSNTCVAPSATWKGATITLPCGDLLWSRPGADELRNLLNVFYGGFICYYAIRRLFLLIENLKDPTKDNLEVTDL